MTAKLFFTDLINGPNSGGENSKGVYVTLYGRGFGAAQGSVTVGGGAADIISWTQGGTTGLKWPLDKVVIQLNSNCVTGNIVLTPSGGSASNGIAFTVRAGGIYFVTTTGSGSGTVASPYGPEQVAPAMVAGDTFYFRTGTYSGSYGDDTWGTRNWAIGVNYANGTAANPIAFCAYPGETVIFDSAGSNFEGTDNGSDPNYRNYLVIANFTLQGGDYNVGTGGNTTDTPSYNKGGTGWRIIGNICSCDYTGNTMTGMIAINGDYHTCCGNELKNTGTQPPINNNHGIYIQLGPIDAVVAWNYLHDLKMGHTIQCHTDNAQAFVWQNTRIHSNIITAAAAADCRGISMGQLGNSSTIYVYNNLLVNLGQSFSSVIAYAGTNYVYNNTLHNVNSALALSRQNGQTPTMHVRNNILSVQSGVTYLAVDGGALMSDYGDVSDNCYQGNGNGPADDSSPINDDPEFVNTASSDYRLQSTSPCIGAGFDLSGVFTDDIEGVARGAVFDVGAFEYSEGGGGGGDLPKRILSMMEA